MKNPLKSIIRSLRSYKMTIKVKLVLALSSVAVILLLSSVISIVEYRRMSNYVSDLIASNINSINVSQHLASLADSYNLSVLAVVGDETTSQLPELDQDLFLSKCDSLKNSFTSVRAIRTADSLSYAYAAYLLTSQELMTVISSDFIDSREWYFDRLQPKYNKLRGYIDKLSTLIYDDLEHNSETYQDGFYRSIVPGVVSVAAGLILIFLLIYFVTSYYVNPLGRMLSGMRNYNSSGRRYINEFDGDDELKELNDGIRDIIDENIELKKRRLRASD